MSSPCAGRFDPPALAYFLGFILCPMCVCARARMCVCVCVSARERVNQRTCILLGGCSDKMCTGVLVRMIWRQALVASLYSLHSTHLFAGQRRRFHLHWVVV